MSEIAGRMLAYASVIVDDIRVRLEQRQSTADSLLVFYTSKDMWNKATLQELRDLASYVADLARDLDMLAVGADVLINEVTSEALENDTQVSIRSLKFSEAVMNAFQLVKHAAVIADIDDTIEKMREVSFR